MNKQKIPEGYQAVMPYLILKNAQSFLDFAKKVFGAKEKFKEMRDEKIIRHAEIDIDGSIIMFADSTEIYEPRTAGFFIHVDNADDSYKIALAEGATSISEPADQSYGRSCGVVDPTGNTWWITSVL